MVETARSVVAISRQMGGHVGTDRRRVRVVHLLGPRKRVILGDVDEFGSMRVKDARLARRVRSGGLVAEHGIVS